MNTLKLTTFLSIFVLGCWDHGVVVSFDDDVGLFDTSDSPFNLDTEADTEADTSVDTEQPSDPGDDTSYETGGCGDGYVNAPEVCDDGNNEAGDGCTSNCSFIEENYECPYPGDPCISLLDCGDGIIAGDETCDDNNEKAGDGCSAECQVEAGWICPNMGARCVAAACGDGIVAGSEECEDGDDPPADGDGCSAGCKREDGYACDTAGDPCHVTVCNDGTWEGSEPCDDGNLVIGDGCTPFCEVEPDCSAGPCSSACGDGIILPGDNEACDDGNTQSGDGCSSTCQQELGFECTLIQGQLADTLDVPVTFRDFIALPETGYTRHPDFEFYGGSQPSRGLVENQLGSDGKPVYTGLCEDDTDPANNSNDGLDTDACPYFEQMKGEAEFDQWYNDDTDVNITKVEHLTLGRDTDDDSYKHWISGFYPWDDDGWVDPAVAGELAHSNGHNYGYTSEIRYWFEYKGGEQLYFSGDDDVWVFMNGKLALDLGGMHPERDGSITLDTEGVAIEEDVEMGISQQIDLGMEVGKIYETVLFHAERHSTGSNFNLTLTGFVSASSECVTDCGDGIVAGDEVCDLGTAHNNGGYGECDADCLGRGPYCGDGVVDTDHELCDESFNLATHTFEEIPGCAPGCVFGAYCGDSEVDGAFGEQCDDGILAGGYDECGQGCQIDRYCGDGQLDTDEGEQCDDGNQVSGDGCTKDCFDQVIL